MLQRGVVERRHVPEPHAGDVEHERRDRVRERAGGLLDALDPPRDRAQDHLRQSEGEQDRRDVDDQQVLDHVHDEELLAEAVDGRDSATNRAPMPAANEAAASRSAAPGAGLGARRAASGAHRSPSTAASAKSTPGVQRPRIVAEPPRGDCRSPRATRDAAGRQRRAGCSAGSPTNCSPCSCRRPAWPAGAPSRERASRCARPAGGRCRGCRSRAARAADCRRRAGHARPPRAAFDAAWAPLAHDGPARALVAALKFRGRLPVADADGGADRRDGADRPARAARRARARAR